MALPDYRQEGYGAVPQDYAGGYNSPPADYYGADDYGGYGPEAGGGYGPDPGPGYGQHSLPYDYDADHVGEGQDPNQSYQKYTESKTASNTIDPDNGIAPRRCTDCICLFVFMAYVLGMVILVIVTKNRSIGERSWSDVRRLTHGHDYDGRLCGVDAGVEHKPFLFWCRNDAREWGPTPTKLNLLFPSCVEACPMVTNATKVFKVGCLFNQTVQQMSIQGGPFATVETYHVQFQQSVAITNPYDSIAFGGRFCVPQNLSAREEVLHGPLRHSRLFTSVGSFQDPWFVLFQAMLISILLGYLYVFSIRLAPKLFTISLLYLTWILFTAAGCFFAYAIVSLVVVHTGNESLLETFKYKVYQEYNPLYEQYSPESATIVSTVAAAVLWFISCGVLGTITHVAGEGFQYVPDLVDAATDCFEAMKSMLVPPGIEAFVKFILTWILMYNFMSLVSVGWYEERRLMVNEKLYKDATALYHFDTSILPWMAYYIFGSVWILELSTSCGQFLISFSVISWYFIKKDGHVKRGVPPMSSMHGAISAIMFHSGSLCLGAAIIPWIRVIRLFNWVEDESVPNEEAACCPCEDGCIPGALNACCRCVGRLCNKLTKFRKNTCMPACCLPVPDSRSEGIVNGGCAYRYSKNAYNDVIIRSQHFLQASNRALRLIHRYKSTRTFVLEGKGCQVVTAVGVMSIGVIGAIFTHLSIMGNSSLTDPSSGAFIAEPICVTVLAFFMCANIGYGFMMLFGHTADTLLYCYAWNKKFSDDVGGAPVEDYLPETLSDLVDGDREDDDEYSFYGQAPPQMYLGTWLYSNRSRMKNVRKEDKARQSAIQASTATMGAANSALSTLGTPGQYNYATANSQIPYQAVGNTSGPYSNYPGGTA